MALPQLPAHAQHQLGQRVIEQGTRLREYMQKSRTTVRLFSCMQSLLCQERVLFWEIQTILFFLSSLVPRVGGDEEVPWMALRVLRPKSPHSEEWTQYIECSAFMWHKYGQFVQKKQQNWTICPILHTLFAERHKKLAQFRRTGRVNVIKTYD